MSCNFFSIGIQLIKNANKVIFNELTSCLIYARRVTNFKWVDWKINSQMVLIYFGGFAEGQFL